MPLPILRVLTVIVARNCASSLLSPSTANCSKVAVGVDHDDGMDDSNRRVKPPPGMNGMVLEVPALCSWSAGDV